MNSVLILAQLVVLLVATEVTTSSANFDLPELQKNLEEKLEYQLKSIQEKINHIDWFFKVGYHNQDKPIMDDIDEFVSNPINTYTMIKRLSVYWPPLKEHLFNETTDNHWDKLMDDIKAYNEALETDGIWTCCNIKEIFFNINALKNAG